MNLSFEVTKKKKKERKKITHISLCTEFEDKTRACHYNYISNDCGPDLKGTYWQTFCDEWDRYPFIFKKK